MLRIYEPRDLMEAQMLVGMLETEGIEARVVGSDLLGAIGELPALGLLGLLVAAEQAERARSLIAAYNAALPVPGDEPDHEQGTLLC
ncbi:putative signal transducing protein [Pseudomonas mangrovi]|jgi:hypothetical protein|uniref:DUF2007 domain-containing protein n=1 Tax=Pseudomonas mangrovi TaxID=2161748 RepID=A0A2T5PAA3_9PSED|nr:DUF2007 domain-containing protein [Pseudomonas mangrovi]PTU74657.1 hypothetical protein DBO85_08880 [Pseudomonas mangrovi]